MTSLGARRYSADPTLGKVAPTNPKATAYAIRQALIWNMCAPALKLSPGRRPNTGKEAPSAGSSDEASAEERIPRPLVVMDPGASSDRHVGSVQNASDEPRPDHLGRAETGLDLIVGCSAPCGHEEEPIDDLARHPCIDGFVQRRQVDHDVPVHQPCGGQDSLELRRGQDGRRVRERRLGTGRKE